MSETSFKILLDNKGNTYKHNFFDRNYDITSIAKNISSIRKQQLHYIAAVFQLL